MPRPNNLKQLRNVLASLFPEKADILKIIEPAGLGRQHVELLGSGINMWHAALTVAQKRNLVDRIVAEAMGEFPDNPYLRAARGEKEIDYILSPDLDTITKWEPVKEEFYEALTHKGNTILPINFLTKGIFHSRPVAKVQIDQGAKYDVGTGFLFRLKGKSETLFMTNQHVLQDYDCCLRAKVIFNYELDENNRPKGADTFDIDPNGPFVFSDKKELDVTVVRLQNPAGKLDQYNFLTLEDVKVEAQDYVNIIQHPAGQEKMISLYHNVVTYTDERVVQYLTDTDEGSSGAPVFNSAWKIVALHHSYNYRQLNEPKLPAGFKLRNEGILINRIIELVENEIYG